MIRFAILATAASMAALPVQAQAQSPAGPDHPQTPLWPQGAPGGGRVTAQEAVVERSSAPADLRDRYVRHVRNPTLTVFRPKAPNGVSLLMAPGGGYKWVVMDKEGYEAAERFAAAGVTVHVMTYRLPGDGWAAGPDVALADAQRALRLVRRQAEQEGLDPRKVGVMGFSAGGHVAGSLTLRFDAPVYGPTDAVDKLSARPDFSVLMYPVATMGRFAHAGSRHELLGDTPTAEQATAYSLEKTVRPDAPPVMLFHAVDDASVPVENSLDLMAALRAAKVPVEAHFYEEGGHGFGIRYAKGKPAEAWPDAVLAWMRRKGF
jgi:acetyl esterase/lipase